LSAEPSRAPCQILEAGGLSMAALKPRDETLDELGVARGPLVHERILLRVREVERRDTLANRTVEELKARGDESLNGAAVQSREARQLLVVGGVEGVGDGGHGRRGCGGR